MNTSTVLFESGMRVLASLPMLFILLVFAAAIVLSRIHKAKIRKHFEEMGVAVKGHPWFATGIDGEYRGLRVAYREYRGKNSSSTMFDVRHTSPAGFKFWCWKKKEGLVEFLTEPLSVRGVPEVLLPGLMELNMECHTADGTAVGALFDNRRVKETMANLHGIAVESGGWDLIVDYGKVELRIGGIRLPSKDMLDAMCDVSAAIAGQSAVSAPGSSTAASLPKIISD